MEQIFRHKRELSLQLSCEECLIDSEATVRVDTAFVVDRANQAGSPEIVAELGKGQLRTR